VEATHEIERLKSVIIEHVAKDVLLLTDNVEKLNTQLELTGNLLKLLESNTEKQFDLASKQILDFLVEQEKHLANIADSRTKQISLTISDNVEKILIEKFETYQQLVSKALEKFNTANVAAVESLNSSYNNTEKKMKEKLLSNPNKNKTEKILMAAILILSVISVAGISSLVLALLI